MEITKEALEARLAQIRAAKANLEAQLNSACGAEQECMHWLSILETTREYDEG